LLEDLVYVGQGCAVEVPVGVGGEEVAEGELGGFEDGVFYFGEFDVDEFILSVVYVSKCGK
jgi:hypothetical protein